MSILRDSAAELARSVYPQKSLHDAFNRQILKLAEEVGEIVGAYNRWSGNHRESGPIEDIYTELADLVITAYITAARIAIEFDPSFNLDELIDNKLAIVQQRYSQGSPHHD